MLVRSRLRVAFGVTLALVLVVALGALTGPAAQLPGATLPTLSDSTPGDDPIAGLVAIASPVPILAALALALALVAFAGTSPCYTTSAEPRTRGPPPH